MSEIIKIAVITDKLNNQGIETNGYKIYLSIAFYQKATVMLYGHQDKFDEQISKADLILCLGTIIYNKNLYQIQELAKMKKPGAKLVLWYFDACNPDFKHSKWKHDNIVSILPYLNWLFTTDHSFPWETKIKNYYHLSQGIYLKDFENEPIEREKEYDIIFTGGTAGEFSYREKLLSAIKKAGYKIAVYGSNSNGRIYGDEFKAEYEKSKIALVPQSHEKINNQYWSNRIYLATATGTPCIVGDTPGIEKQFISGKEILIYKTESELLKHIKYLKANLDKASQIGHYGRLRTIRNHTYRERIKEMLKVIS